MTTSAKIQLFCWILVVGVATDWYINLSILLDLNDCANTPVLFINGSSY